MTTYCISYAYPTSISAKRNGIGKTGGYVLEVDTCTSTHATLPEAIEASKRLIGCTPHRWSIDHPANAAFAA